MHVVISWMITMLNNIRQHITGQTMKALSEALGEATNDIFRLSVNLIK